MIQPKGTKTYKGLRVSKPGAESYEKNENVLKEAGKFHKDGKDSEKRSKKPIEAVKPDLKTPKEEFKK